MGELVCERALTHAVRSLMFCCRCLLTLLLATYASTLTVRSVPQGVISINQGTAVAQDREYEVIIVRQHPSAVQKQFLPVLRKLSEALIQYKNSSGPLADLFNERYQFLNQYAKSKDKTRSFRNKRWAPLEPIGAAVGNLFGLASARDVNKVKDTVNAVLDNMNAQQMVVEGLTAVVNDIIGHQQKVRMSVNVLTNQITNMTRSLDLVQQNIDKIAEVVIINTVSIFIEATLSKLERYYHEAKRFEDEYKFLRDIVQIGHLTERLVARRLLTKILKQLRIGLAPEYLYKYLPVELIKLSRDQIGYRMFIPVFGSEKYTAWQLFTIPFIQDQTLLQIVPEINFVGVGQESGTYISLDDCQFKDPKICAATVAYRQMDCVQGILEKDPLKLIKCNVETVSVSDIYVIRVNIDELLFASKGAIITERCFGTAPKLITIPAGTYALFLTPGCTIEQDRQWKYTLSHQAPAVRFAVRDQYVLPELNITYPQEKLNLTKINMAHEQLEELQEFAYAKIPDMNNWKQVEYLTVYDNYVGWIAIGLICGIAAAIAIWKLWLSDKCRKTCMPKLLKYREAIRKRPAALQPTLEMPIELEEIKMSPLLSAERVYPRLNNDTQTWSYGTQTAESNM